MIMKKITFVILFGFSILNHVSAQETEIYLKQYTLRDHKLMWIINDTLKSNQIDSLKSLGYKPVLYIRPIYDCVRKSKFDSIKRSCIEYTLNLEKVTPAITSMRTKVAVTKIGKDEVFLVLYQYDGLISLPYQVKVSVLPYNSRKDLPTKQIFLLIFNGEEYIKN